MYNNNRKPPGSAQACPSDSQAREKLALYVYEYLVHTGASRAADLFLQEIQWQKTITVGDSPGFLQSWWCVFWDLYCAAPERRDSCDHSQEAKAFHDFGLVGGYPLVNGIHGQNATPSPIGGMPGQAGGPPDGMPPGTPGGMSHGAFFGPHGPGGVSVRPSQPGVSQASPHSGHPPSVSLPGQPGGGPPGGPRGGYGVGAPPRLRSHPPGSVGTPDGNGPPVPPGGMMGFPGPGGPPGPPFPGEQLAGMRGGLPSSIPPSGPPGAVPPGSMAMQQRLPPTGPPNPRMQNAFGAMRFQNPRSWQPTTSSGPPLMVNGPSPGQQVMPDDRFHLGGPGNGMPPHPFPMSEAGVMPPSDMMMMNGSEIGGGGNGSNGPPPQGGPPPGASSQPPTSSGPGAPSTASGVAPSGQQQSSVSAPSTGASTTTSGAGPPDLKSSPSSNGGVGPGSGTSTSTTVTSGGGGRPGGADGGVSTQGGRPTSTGGPSSVPPPAQQDSGNGNQAPRSADAEPMDFASSGGQINEENEEIAKIKASMMEETKIFEPKTEEDSSSRDYNQY